MRAWDPMACEFNSNPIFPYWLALPHGPSTRNVTIDLDNHGPRIGTFRRGSPGIEPFWPGTRVYPIEPRVLDLPDISSLPTLDQARAAPRGTRPGGPLGHLQPIPGIPRHPAPRLPPALPRGLGTGPPARATGRAAGKITEATTGTSGPTGSPSASAAPPQLRPRREDGPRLPRPDATLPRRRARPPPGTTCWTTTSGYGTTWPGTSASMPPATRPTVNASGRCTPGPAKPSTTGGPGRSSPSGRRQATTPRSRESHDQGVCSTAPRPGPPWRPTPTGPPTGTGSVPGSSPGSAWGSKTWAGSTASPGRLDRPGRQGTGRVPWSTARGSRSRRRRCGPGLGPGQVQRARHPPGQRQGCGGQRRSAGSSGMSPGSRTSTGAWPGSA